ncbi:hypothetical protein FRC12_002170 [Ceratobasidium sp. 428]|nr:hypothetical protein FRC12_002170 [Ceratobasidium sp. 428]
MNWVSSVAFSPDNTRIVSGSGDHAIRIWELGTNFSKDDNIWYSWYLNKDGWVVGPASQLLLWVPPELRAGLKRPQNSVVIHRRVFSSSVLITLCLKNVGVNAATVSY